MAVDYQKAAATALRLINENGRAVTLVKLGQVAADPAKPWRANPNNRVTPQAEQPATGVFVPASGSALGFLSEDNEMVKQSEQILLVAAAGVVGYKVEDFNEVVDPDDAIDTRWRITGVELLKPGAVRILYAIGVKR